MTIWRKDSGAGMWRKAVHALLALAAAGALLAGCEDKGAEETKSVPPVQNAAAVQERQKVSIGFWGLELQASYANFLCEKFPDVDFEFIFATNSLDYYRYLAEHDDLPDILTVRRFSLKDALALKDRLYDLANTEVAAGFYGSYLDSYIYEDGTVNWLPACAEVDSIIVNTTLFKEHGIAVPHDYASFMEACRAFEGTGVKGFAADYFDDYNCMELLQGFSIPHLISLEGRQWRRKYESGEADSLSREVWLPVFEKFFDMKKGTGFAREDVFLRNWEMKNLYMEGRAAMYRGTGSDLANIPARQGDASVLLPYFAERQEENCYLTYPAFQAAVAGKGMEDKKREALILNILSAMLSQEGQANITRGKSMVAYNKNVTIPITSDLSNLKSAIAENRMYIRLASHEMFALSRNVVQRILREEIQTPEEALAAFNALMQKGALAERKAVAHIGTAYSREFSHEHGNQAASALFNTARVEAGKDLLLAQAGYASAVYAGDYTAKDVRYLTKNDNCWPVMIDLTGEQLFTVADELLKIKGRYGSVTNESTLYVSSGFEMQLVKTGDGFALEDLTVNGEPMDRKKTYSVYLLCEGEITLPLALKKAGIEKFENFRVHTNDYIQKRLVEKGGDLEKPTDYISIR